MKTIINLIITATLILLSASQAQNVLVVQKASVLPSSQQYVPLTIYIEKSSLIEQVGITIHDVQKTTIGLANNSAYTQSNPVRPHLVQAQPSRPNGIIIEASPVITGSSRNSRSLKIHIYGDSASVNLDGYASEVFTVHDTRFQNVFTLRNSNGQQDYQVHFSGYGIRSRVSINVKGLINGSASGYISKSY